MEGLRDAMCYSDPDPAFSGFQMMPGSQRPDGTWRKPRKVREGYTPQDEVPLYESKGRVIAKESNYIPGLQPFNPSPEPPSYLPTIHNFKMDTFVIPPPVITIPGLNPNTTPTPSTSTKSKKKKKPANNSLGPGIIGTPSMMDSVTSDLANVSMSSLSMHHTATDPAKKIRNLRKKLRDIEALESKLTSGEISSPEPEQLEKVSRKSDVICEISALENMLA